MTTFGNIKPAKDDKGRDRRLEVWFTGGNLKPALDTDAATRKQWIETFGSAQKEKTPDMGTMFSNFLGGLMMGLKPPEGVDRDGTQSFEMTRPAHGYTDILYIDDRLRVTKGNRGSIVVVTRE